MLVFTLFISSTIGTQITSHFSERLRIISSNTWSTLGSWNISGPLNENHQSFAVQFGDEHGSSCSVKLFFLFVN